MQLDPSAQPHAPTHKPFYAHLYFQVVTAIICIQVGLAPYLDSLSQFDDSRDVLRLAKASRKGL